MTGTSLIKSKISLEPRPHRLVVVVVVSARRAAAIDAVVSSAYARVRFIEIKIL